MLSVNNKERNIKPKLLRQLCSTSFVDIVLQDTQLKKHQHQLKRHKKHNKTNTNQMLIQPACLLFKAGPSSASCLSKTNNFETIL